MDLQKFSFNDHDVRVISVNGDPWFIASDVCEILDLGNISQACKPLKSREKDLYNNDTLGGNQDVVIISESGLYRLTMKSRKPQAEPFQDWVCEEILPSIRKTGKYEVQSQPVLPQSFPEALRLLANEVEQNQKLLQANQALQVEVQTLEPKAERYDLVMDSEGWLTGEQISKQLAIPKFSVRKLYDILREEKVLFRRADGLNGPYAEWVNDGLAKIAPSFRTG